MLGGCGLLVGMGNGRDCIVGMKMKSCWGYSSGDVCVTLHSRICPRLSMDGWFARVGGHCCSWR